MVTPEDALEPGEEPIETLAFPWLFGIEVKLVLTDRAALWTSSPIFHRAPRTKGGRVVALRVSVDQIESVRFGLPVLRWWTIALEAALSIVVFAISALTYHKGMMQDLRVLLPAVALALYPISHTMVASRLPTLVIESKQRWHWPCTLFLRGDALAAATADAERVVAWAKARGVEVKGRAP